MDPICATDCSTTLPVVSFDNCNPSINESEINKIFLALPTASPFTLLTDATEWANRLSQTAIVPAGGLAEEPPIAPTDLIRELTVIADKPAPSSIVRDISNGRKKVTGKNHVINATVDETNDQNHEFLRGLECGGSFKLWYLTKGGKLFGGVEGITVDIDGNMILNRGDGEIETQSLVITWKSKFTEEFVISPL